MGFIAGFMCINLDLFWQIWEQAETVFCIIKLIGSVIVHYNLQIMRCNYNQAQGSDKGIVTFNFSESKF